MPLTLTLTLAPVPSVLAVAQRGTLWHRLQRLAVRAIQPLVTFWETLFREVRRALDVAALTAALRAAHLLDAEQEVMRIWRQKGEDEARALLPVLLRDLWRQVGDVVAPAMAEVVGRPVPFVMSEAEPQQELSAYANAQVTLITGTTLLGLRHLLRGGRVAGMRPDAHAATIQAGFGLTPQQIRSLTLARERWQQEGRSASVIQDAVAQAVALGITRRVRAIAETQAFGAVNLGHRLAVTQAAQASLGRGAQLRRYWHLQPGACPVCRQVPGMNPQGVGLQEPFATPQGAVMDPGLHVLCRCMVDYRVPGGP